jgi:pimeloyl-ACP methyl ester carboxylesterase
MRMVVNCIASGDTGTLPPPLVNSRVLKLGLLALAIALTVCLVLLLLAWAYQERVVFQPPQGLPPAPTDARRVTYAAEDGTRLFGYLIGDARSAPVVMLAFHGNADLARWQVPWGEEVVRRTGAAVLLAEYRGYDGLDGRPTYTGAGADARAALAFLRDSARVDADRLVYFGHSLGSAVATELATEAPVRTLVLQSPFTSVRDMATRFPVPGIGWLWPVLARVHFDTEQRVRKLGASVWVAHGDRDFVIPVRMGRAVFDAAPRKGELLIVPGAGHNDVDERAGASYWEWLRAALGVERAAAPLGRGA